MILRFLFYKEEASENIYHKALAYKTRVTCYNFSGFRPNLNWESMAGENYQHAWAVVKTKIDYGDMAKG